LYAKFHYWFFSSWIERLKNTTPLAGKREIFNLCSFSNTDEEHHDYKEGYDE